MYQKPMAKQMYYEDTLYHQDFCLGTFYFNSLQKLTLEKQALPIVLPHGGTHSNRGPTATEELWKPLPYTEW